ncbi:MAG: triple tyrosine motif-containing protein [Verrucomicrobia bacterium]|nr:triple tyrosine motif-containing protein [Verrucomicrobiota bacterium]
MTMTALTGVPLLLTLFASAGVRAEEPAAASAGPSGPSPSPAPSTNSAWISRAWQSDDGLPGNRVVGVAQTPDGFVRVATESGLARFDGVQFREAASAGVIAPSGSRILGFLADSRGRLWLGKLTSTAGGAVVCVEAGRTRLFTHDDGLIDSPVLGLMEDGEGAVWATSPDGVCRIQQGRIRSFAGKAGLTGSGPPHLAMDGRGRLWFAEQRRVGVYREGAFRTLLTLGESHTALSGAKSGGIWICVGTRVLKYTGDGEPQDLGVLAPNRPEVKPNIVCEDRRGWLWVGTGKTGLFLYNGSGFQLVDRPSHEILSLAEDRESNLWAGTDGGGLVRVKPRAFNLEVLSSDSPDGMRSVCQDAGGTLWAVTLSGRLAQKKGSLWRVLSAQDGWSGPPATCVTPAPEGGVWVGTESEGLHGWREGVERSITTSNGLAGSAVSVLLTTPSGDVWVGTVGMQAVQRLRAGQIQTFMLPQILGPFGSLAVDAAGQVWAATEGGVLARVDGTTLADETTNTLGVVHPISSLCATPDGSLWIGYRGRGVGRLKQGRFTRFDHEQGLLDDFINGVLADGRGRLWFAANRGLFCVAVQEFESLAEGRKRRVHPVVYGRDEGLPISHPVRHDWSGEWRSVDGRLWMSMASGVAAVAPDKLTENREPPAVVIERLTVDGRTVAAYEAGEQAEGPNSATPIELRQSGERLRLPPGVRQMELEYTGLSFVSPHNVAFKYRLEGLDSDWVEAGSRRVAYYSHLVPGDYRFKVMACNNDGVWNDAGASLAITVLPYFWQTGWFIGLAALTALGAAGGTARQMERRRLRRKLETLERQQVIERERVRIAKDIHDDLGASLTHIKLLGELVEGEDTVAGVFTHTRKMAETTRGMAEALDEIVWAVRPQNDTLESLVDYMGRAADEFFENTRVLCRQNLSRPVPACEVSAEVRHNLFLAFREALSNIGKHAQATEVSIDLAIDLPRLRIVIVDNGKGFDPALVRPGRNGLTNLSQRLADIGGHCAISSQPGTGTKVKMEITLQATQQP